jgi:hypothetical protein
VPYRRSGLGSCRAAGRDEVTFAENIAAESIHEVVAPLHPFQLTPPLSAARVKASRFGGQALKPRLIVPHLEKNGCRGERGGGNLPADPPTRVPRPPSPAENHDHSQICSRRLIA